MKRRGQSEYALEYKVKDPEQEDDNRDLVDTVHHSDINVGRPGRIFLSEKIATHLTERKKLFPASFLFLVICVMCFHVRVAYVTDEGSIQFPSLLMISISSSTAFAEGTFLFTTSFPRYRVILPGPEPTYP
jgi:hypothetical protein